MSNRTAARKYKDQFEALAEHPTPENKRKAQKLYEQLFIINGVFESYGKFDFHPGEMYCNEALRTLGVHRHPDDHYLERRGITHVMEGTA
jgi:hypothetical protein